jgi:hypothetical protein
MIALTRRKKQRSRNIVALQVWKVGKNFFACSAAREQFQNINHANAHPANARTAAALQRVERDAIQKIGFHSGNDTPLVPARTSACGYTRARMHERTLDG